MNKLLLLVIFSLINTNAFAGFVHPMDFKLSQKNEVIEFIKEGVRKDYCNGMVDMCNNSTLRMMEKENLNAFKELTKAKNREIMNRVIKDYCNSSINMCSYSNILMMYEENLRASQKELEW